MKSIIDINNISRADLDLIFTTAENQSKRGVSAFPGKVVLSLFPETSLRTRVTFESAALQLNCKLVNLPNSILDKGEEVSDIVQYLNNWIDLLIVRHNNIDLIREMEKFASFPIINAMTKENHPCEIISDCYSLLEMGRDLPKVNAAFIGGKGNITHSWFNMAKKMGFQLTQICPQGYEVDPQYLNPGQTRIVSSLSELNPQELKEFNLILTDNWTSDEALLDKFRITSEVLNQFSQDALFNPCPPFKRGREISQGAIENKRFWGYEPKKNLQLINISLITCLLNSVCEK